MSLFNQDNNSFQKIDTTWPFIYDWCHQCDFCGGEWIQDEKGYGSGRECSNSRNPHLIDGTPVGDVKPGAFRSHFMDVEYLRCDKRYTGRWTVKQVLQRMTGKEKI